MLNDVSIPLAVLIASLLVLGLVTMAWLWRRRRGGLELTPYEPRRPVPWRGIDVLLGLVLFVLMRFAADIVALWQLQQLQTPVAELPPRDTLILLLADSAGSLAALAMTVVLLVVRHDANSRDLGVAGGAVGRDVRLGIVGFLAILVPIYALNVLATALFKPESEHPLIKLIKEAPEPLLLVGAAVAAVLVAPVVEEFFFRVVFQGWLESLASRYGPSPAPAILEAADRLEAETPASPRPAEGSKPESNPYASPAATGDAAYAAAEPAPGQAVAVWPIFVSSALFAAVHIGHGVDFIPLFFLALALGYLYRRTHRIWPSMVLHACLNATSLLMLWLSLKG